MVRTIAQGDRGLEPRGRASPAPATRSNNSNSNNTSSPERGGRNAHWLERRSGSGGGPPSPSRATSRPVPLRIVARCCGLHSCPSPLGGGRSAPLSAAENSGLDRSEAQLPEPRSRATRPRSPAPTLNVCPSGWRRWSRADAPGLVGRRPGDGHVVGERRGVHGVDFGGAIDPPAHPGAIGRRLSARAGSGVPRGPWKSRHRKISAARSPSPEQTLPNETGSGRLVAPGKPTRQPSLPNQSTLASTSRHSGSA